jgi:serine/threonine-protein kinase
VCHLTLQAAEGLAAIHEAGIIHRDVKAANLMIDVRGVVRLVDFGIARGDSASPPPDLTTESRRLTDSRHVVGSPGYMSPEQICGGAIDARSDLYSLGIVLYELLTGRLPFEAASAPEVMLKHLYEEVPLEGTGAATLPPVVLPILRRALAKKPAERYQTARALIRDLRRVRDRLDVSDVGSWSGSSTLPRRSMPRPQLLWWLCGSLIVGLAAFVALKVTLVPVAPVVSSPPVSSRAPATAVATPPAPAHLPTVAAPALDRGPARSPRAEPTEAAPAKAKAGPVPVAAAPLPPDASESPDASREGVAAPTASDGDVADEPVAETPSSATPTLPTPTPSPPALPDLAANPGVEPASESYFMADDPEVVAPSCLKCPVDYPPIAERLQVQGDVEMRILVSGEGRVVKTEVLSGHRDLRNGAEASVRKWIYRPATKRGRPGMIWLIVTVRFNLS